MTSSIRDTDKGYRKVIAQVGKISRGYSAVIGVFGEGSAKEHGSDGISLGELAFIHEMGLGVPQRSWLRSWVDSQKARIDSDLRKIADQGLRGEDLGRALSRLAARYAAEVQAWISGGNVEPPLADSTIERKGSSVPLIDTGQLRSGITWGLEVIQGRKILNVSE